MLSRTAAEHVAASTDAGRLEGATHAGLYGTPGCGPYVRLWFRVESGIVRRATFETQGCPSSIAAASALCRLATGREVRRLLDLEPGELLRFLGGLPEGKEHFATYAVEALRQGLREK